MWRTLNEPSAFDGREAAEIDRVADRLAGMGLYDEADRLRGIAVSIRPMLTWYGEAANQAAHGFMGVFSTVVFCAAWREVAGEMPVKSWAFLALFVPWTIGIQWLVQHVRRKMRGKSTAPLSDAAVDGLMFGIAAAGALIPFAEHGIHGRFTMVLYDHRVMGIICAAWLLVFLARVLPRYIDANLRQY